MARRLIAQRCVYGVDRNLMAVDLAKVSLWLATLAKEHPLTFVDHALRHGDSLVGLTQRQIEAFHWEDGAEPLQQGIETIVLRKCVVRVAELRRFPFTNQFWNVRILRRHTVDVIWAYENCHLSPLCRFRQRHLHQRRLANTQRNAGGRAALGGHEADEADPKNERCIFVRYRITAEEAEEYHARRTV